MTFLSRRTLLLMLVAFAPCCVLHKVSAQTITAYPPDQDRWTTSVYSYGPNGGGPGGGLANENLVIGGYGDFYNSLLQFDLTGLPTSASNVELQLYDQSSHGGTPTALNFYQITQPPQSWNWQTTGAEPDHLRLWWQDQPSAVQYSSNPLPAPVPGSYYDINITSLYNGWQNGTIPNDGV